MTTIRDNRIHGWALLCCLLLGISVIGTASAQSDGPLQVRNGVYQDVQVTADDGSVGFERQPAKTVLPGGEVVYVIEYSNSGSEPLTDVAINNPVPAELVFVGVEGTPTTAVSVDGGETFGQLTDLTVADADGASRAAQPADVTVLRWVIESIAPGAGGTVTYRARVR